MNKKYLILIGVVVILLFVFTLYGAYKRKQEPKVIFYRQPVDKGGKQIVGRALIPFYIKVNLDAEVNKLHPEGYKNVLNHELYHWKQFQREGLWGFYFKYLYYFIKYPHDKNPYEIEARQHMY